MGNKEARIRQFSRRHLLTASESTSTPWAIRLLVHFYHAIFLPLWMEEVSILRRRRDSFSASTNRSDREQSDILGTLVLSAGELSTEGSSQK